MRYGGLFLLTPALAALLFCCHDAEGNRKMKKHPGGAKNKALLDTVIESNHKFAEDLYTAVVASSEPDENVVLSPISLQMALAMCYLGTAGDSAEQLARALHFPNQPGVIKNGFRQIMRHIKSMENSNVTTNIANAVFVQTGFNLQKEYKRMARKIFKAEVKEANFAKNAEKVRKIINAWVEKKTNKKINNLIAQGVLNPLTRLVLLNAVYFKGLWKQPFNTGDVTTQTFYIDENRQVDVQMMHIKFYFGYMNLMECNCKILEIPYEDSTTSMFIVLPNERNGLQQVESNILEIMEEKELFQEMPEHEVEVAIPKFKTALSVDLKGILIELGVRDIFSEDLADLSGISGNKDLHVSKVVQKAFIEVTELGTEAGAATAIIAEARSWRPAPPQFIADHPFLFLIVEKQKGTIYFMGRFSQPE